MEKATEVSLVIGTSEDLSTADDSAKAMNRVVVTKEEKVMEKEDEDTTFDGGFVKVEKEGIDTKYDDDDEKADKQVLETSVADITSNAAKSKEKCDELEEKLKVSDALLSQALSKNSALEQKLETLEGFSKEVAELKSALIVAEEERKNSTREMEEYQETSQSKLEKAEEKLNVSAEKERELSKNLKSAEERLEKQAREIDEASARSIELETFHKHSELRIQKAVEDFSSRDTEAKSLAEKSKDLEERLRLHEEKLAEASAHSFSLKEDLDQSSLENELLVDTNNQLKIKIQELEGFLDFEKDTTARQAEEANELITMLKSHDNLIEEHKRQVLEASGVSDTRKTELEEALSKLMTFEATIIELEKENGSLAEVNLKLNQELANHGSETSDFQVKLSALETEKDQASKELQAAKTAIEDLTNKLTSEGERLRSQISSLAEENNQVNEIYQSTKNELVKLQEQLQVEKSKSDASVTEIKKLSAVAAEKSVLESNFEEVEKQLKKVEAQLKQEVEKVAEMTSKLQEHEHKASDRDVQHEQALLLHRELQASHTVISEEKEAVSQKRSELEATLKKSQEELETKKIMIRELEQKVQLADAKSKVTESIGEEVKSRDIDLSFVTPKQSKSMNKSDASPSVSSSTRNVTIQKTETSHLMTLKIVLGVALVSVIIGIILGKRY
ncbi:unnamed protein product [Microthlaspi erraticum]|uniref:Uncharacterized protein n=1 Tax=Microthlaspi erraticum TaxID=1685480 RepID=A0A6D2KLX9_9BRAS|nr:unnamed protein product [Microthlaspi erraticum]